MSDIIQRVANDIQAHMRKQGCDCLFLDDGVYMQGIARVAIEAMREPTENMLFVGSNDEAGFTARNLHGSWLLMIDEALK